MDTQRFRDLFEGSVQGYIVDRDLKPVFANQAFADIFGCPGPESVLGADTLADFIAPHDRQRLLAYRDARLRGEPAPATYEFQGVKADGSLIWLENSVSVFDWDGVEVLLTSVTNIESRKRTEPGPSEAAQRLSQAEQINQTVSKFLANVSHELRTPLNAIIGFSDIMRQQPPGILDEEKYREYASNIHDSAGHLLNLITEILDISTIDAGEYRFEKEAVQVPELVAECFESMGDLANERGVALVQNLAADLPALQADRRSIRKILLNLLSNAIRFTPGGGRVTVSADADDAAFTVIVADTGVGIPADDIAKLTDPFERGRRDPYRSEEGTGLGLTITLSLVTLHGGTLDIASEVDAGTRVTVCLPIQAAD